MLVSSTQAAGMYYDYKELEMDIQLGKPQYWVLSITYCPLFQYMKKTILTALIKQALATSCLLF